MAIEEILDDLSIACNKCPTCCRVVMGGDFNVHQRNPDFEALSTFLREEANVSLCSDSLYPTFMSSNGSSNPDHIFYTLADSTCKFEVLDNIGSSDHVPMSIRIKFKKKDLASFTNVIEDKSYKLKLNKQAFSEAINDLCHMRNPSLPMNIEEIVSHLYWRSQFLAHLIGGGKEPRICLFILIFIMSSGRRCYNPGIL